MLMSGAETHRVQDTMLRILSVSGRQKIEALALSTMLIVSLPREEKGPLSMARGVSDRSVNFEKICAVNAMSRSFVAGEITLEEASQRLSEIHHTPSFPAWMRVLAYGMTSGGFTLVYNGTPLDGVAAFVIGMLLGLTALWNSRWKAPYFFGSFSGGVVTGVFAALFHLLLPQTQIGMIIIGSIMPLLPGITMTKAIPRYPGRQLYQRQLQIDGSASGGLCHCRRCGDCFGIISFILREQEVFDHARIYDV